MNLLLAATEHANVVERILGPFDWNSKFFIAQVVNFIIVMLVLKKFAFGPIQQILAKRREIVREGEEKLRRIEKQLAESEAYTTASIAKANEEATRLITEAKESSAALASSQTQEAIVQAQSILAKARAAAETERAALMSELKNEFGRLVASTTSQVTGKVLNTDDQRRINEDALTKVEG